MRIQILSTLFLLPALSFTLPQSSSSGPSSQSSNTTTPNTSAAPIPPVRTQFSRVVVFGDSLSDAGNGTYKLTNGARPTSPPYYQGRWSNGPVWPEYAAQAMGVPLEVYAYGGATTDNTFVAGSVPLEDGRNLTIPSVTDQIDTYLQTSPTNPSQTLYIIWAGPNNFFAALSSRDASVLTSDFRTRLAQTLRTSAQKLLSAGAQNIVIFTLPPIESTPAGQNLTETASQAATLVLLDTNTEIKNLTTVQGVKVYDVYETFTGVTAQPAKFGITNGNEACLINHGDFEEAGNMNTRATPRYCSNPDGYVFWDDVHPTTAAHRVLAQNFTEWVVVGMGGGA
ncbi:hypothetical protein HK097_001005, partial [Rhizophlyctis rosea]